MLSPTTPALALFGSYRNTFVAETAESLVKLSGFPVIVRPLNDYPGQTLTPNHDGGISMGSDSNLAAPNDGQDNNGDPMDVDTSGNQNGGGDSGAGGGGRNSDNSAGSGQDADSEDEPDRDQNSNGPHRSNEGGDGGGGGGPSVIDDEWESQLHRTRVKLRLKPNLADIYTISIGYNVKFRINRDTDKPIDMTHLDQPLSQSKAMTLIDFKIETRPRETKLDRSYANIGFVAHRKESIMEREFLNRGFDLPDTVYKYGRQTQKQKGAIATLGLSGSQPMAAASVSYNRNLGTTVEATDSKVMRVKLPVLLVLMDGI
ncbi:hypothetical protein B0H10DRAFT_11451 [Mycena sp. CBHHK59/15]|nr:hypothetical protein B0H10DRAFT_11451 [Mycena sp. CBHHK59/15]